MAALAADVGLVLLVVMQPQFEFVLGCPLQQVFVGQLQFQEGAVILQQHLPYIEAAFEAQHFDQQSQEVFVLTAVFFEKRPLLRSCWVRM